MPFPTLRSRPGTSASDKRHSTFIGASKPKPVAEPKEERKDSLQRLSLNLSEPNGESLGSVFTQEPENIQSDPQLAQQREPLEVNGPKSASTPAALSRIEPREQPLQESKPSPNESATLKPQRFSLLRFRHASDSQLSSKFKKSAPDEPSPAPAIIKTAPTLHEDEQPGKRQVHKLFGRERSPLRKSTLSRQSVLGGLGQDGNGSNSNVAASPSNTKEKRPGTGSRQNSKLQDNQNGPPAYGDEAGSQLAIPVDRLSDSSRSDGSSASNRVYAQTTTTHTISTTTTFFKLKRRKKKDKGPLFPLPEKLAPSSGRTSFSKQTRGSNAPRTSMSPGRGSTNVRFDEAPNRQSSSTASPTHSTMALTNAPFGLAGSTVLRKQSSQSGQSTPPIALVPPRFGARGRSSTLSSLGRSAEKLADSNSEKPPGSTRTSTSTTGRRSFGDLLTLPHRLRQNSAPPTRQGFINSPGTPGSKSNSLQIPREEEPEFICPPREEDDTPASYLEKLEGVVPRGSMASILCKTADEFSKTCLRKYMRGFSYFGESIDMSIRKMLMEVELPKETQQIDRLLAGFADRYYECNPGIFHSTDETAFVAFSILLLHSDTHNKNNKRKMTKQDYFKNTQQGPVQVSADILDCFFDNISYTPFIHFEDEVAITTHRLSVPRSKKSLIPARSNEKLRGPVDPYALLLDNKLDILRPPLKEVLDTEDTYNSTGTATSFDMNDLNRAFMRSAVLQIVSARSRPDAFMNQATITNPAEAQMGLVSIKVAKVGLLWRKDQKRKKGQSPWREWGAILTDSKLYFFRDTGWVKKLVSQYESHTKPSSKAAPLIFKPPVTSFDPDALIAMDDSVALHDSSYKRHKHAFTFIKHGGFEEVLLANSETEMNDWIAKLNYAAAFRTAGVRMRGSLNATYEGRKILRKDSELSTLDGELSVKESPSHVKPVDQQAAWEIMFYRRQLVNEKISDFDEKVSQTRKELEHLLRNARHLMVLLPIQQRTREGLIHSAGRMSAKLKWTRIELWRAKTHHDVLVKDLEQEGAVDFPAPRGSVVVTPQKAHAGKSGQQMLGRTDTDTSRQTLSPVSSVPNTSRRSSQPAVDRPLSAIDRLSLMESHSSVADEASSSRNEGTRPTSPLSQSMAPFSSIKPDEDKAVSSSKDEDESEVRSVHVDGRPDPAKRPETSESDRDRVGAISPPVDFHRDKVDRGSSVRRSLHKSLRDSSGSHYAPSFSKHKKGRESGSSFHTQEGSSMKTAEGNELKRGTGSFILHGKKASVITMSPEWQAMSNEDRLRLRGEQLAHESDKKPDKDENAVEDGTTSNVSEKRSSITSGKDDRRKSAVTATDDEFVDAKTSVENPEVNNRASVFVDARTGDDSEAESSEGEEDGEDETEDSGTGDDDHDNAKGENGVLGHGHSSASGDDDRDDQGSLDSDGETKK